MTRFLALMFVLVAPSVNALSLGETIRLPKKTLTLSSGKDIEVALTIKVINDRMYRIWYDLEKEINEPAEVFSEILEIYALSRSEISAHQCDSAQVWAFTEGQTSEFSCTFYAKTQWQPECHEHEF